MLRRARTPVDLQLTVLLNEVALDNTVKNDVNRHNYSVMIVIMTAGLLG
jgi:hypothetical protein